MRPQRERKRANYVERTPSPETTDHSSPASVPASAGSERSMQSSEPLQKRTRYTYESPQQQFPHRVNVAGFPMALPQPFTTPPAATPSYIAYSSAGGQSPTVPFAVQTPPTLPPVHRSSMLIDVRIGGTTMAAAGLNIPGNISQAEFQRRETEIITAMHHYERDAPALPPSNVADLPPKPHPETWLAFPAGISKDQRLAIEAENNRIATKVQKIERERNNLAAKKSRRKRIEALENTRCMLNESFAELHWWRMRAIGMGASGRDWDNVSQQTRDRMVRDVENRVKEIDDENEQYRKVEEAKKRADRNKTRAALKAKRSNAA